MRDEAPDQLLAAAVIDRGIDEVDASVEHGVEDSFSVFVRNLRTARLPSQLHGAEAESRHIEAGAAEPPPRQIPMQIPSSIAAAQVRLTRRCG
jgi:hypothetical protein